MLDQMLGFLVTPAYADTAVAPAQQGGTSSLILMFVVFFSFIYFAIWRPQNKRAKEQQTLLDSLAKGDEVVTAGGLLGRIVKITDRYVTVSISNNADILMQKSSIVSVLPKGTIKTIE